jgi:hypothetical protein
MPIRRRTAETGANEPQTEYQPLFRNRNDGPGFTRPESYHHRYFWWLHREGASQQILENLSQPVRIGAYDSLVDDDCAKKAVAELTRD